MEAPLALTRLAVGSGARARGVSPGEGGEADRTGVSRRLPRRPTAHASAARSVAAGREKRAPWAVKNGPVFHGPAQAVKNGRSFFTASFFTSFFTAFFNPWDRTVKNA